MMHNVLIKIEYAIKILILLVVTFALCYFNKPEDLSVNGWYSLITFIITILSIILNILPMSVLLLTSIVTLSLFDICDINQLLYYFGSDIVWLVVTAFFISRAIIKSQLTNRIVHYLIYKFGNNVMSLSYCLIFTEFILSPVVPSAAARSGGIILPIANSISVYISKNLKLNDFKNVNFILQSCFHTNIICSAMFLTSMSGNPLISKLISNLGIKINWLSWAKGAIVPGIINLLLLPVYLNLIMPNSNIKIFKLQKISRKHLDNMGILTYKEVVVITTFIFLIIGWMFGDIVLGIKTITISLIGLIMLIVFKVITIDDIISEQNAWNTLVWFGAFIALSSQLINHGVITFFNKHITTFFTDRNLYLSIFVIIIVFFYMHYMFASITVYATLTLIPFSVLLNTLGMPLLLAVMLLAYLANLSGCLTHYTISSGPIIYANSNMSIKEWWKTGFLVSLLNLSVWLIIGSIWWKLIGWW